MVYLIHFDKKFHHACHYIGFCEEGKLVSRMEKHMRGEGSFLMKAVTKAGIKWNLVRVLAWRVQDIRKVSEELQKKALVSVLYVMRSCLSIRHRFHPRYICSPPP